MSFYCVIQTKLSNKNHVIAALTEMRRRGELSSVEHNERKETFEVDRDGDKLKIKQNKKTGDFEIGGDNRVVNRFANRLKQIYALEAIKENMPLDFEVVEEEESGGEIRILLKS